VVARFRDKPLDFQPGEKYSYSNSGYALLSYLIERITGGAYEKFLQDNIFTPLGMKDSGYDSNSAIIPHRASGYAFGKDGFENATYVHMTVPQGAGGLYSTTEDLLKWEQGLFGGKVLSAASLQKMTTPFKSNYAFGLQVDTVGGHKVIEHGGAISGFLTDLAYYPDDKLTVVVLENATGAAPPAAIATKLAELAHGENVKLPSEHKEITLDSKTLRRYVGAYQMDAGVNMVVTLDDNQLSTKLGPQRPIPIYPESPAMFFLKVVDAEIEFAKNDDRGRPTELILHQNGRDMPGKRLDDAGSKRIVDEAIADSKGIADAAAAAAIRFKEQKPMPGSEAALRRDIEELRAGEPKYELMSPGLAGVTRQQLPQLKAAITELGAVQSVTFKGVGPGGADIYEVKFEHGSTEWRISMEPDGRVGGVGFRNQ
jgi:hypothetical protein